jgi:hypothetical protein
MGRVTRFLQATQQPNERPGPKTASRTGLPDQDLARVVAAWPNLPKHIRRSILTLISAAGTRHE